MSHHGNDANKIAQNVKMNTYSRDAVRQVPRQAARAAGRRRVGARSLAHLLRRRHGQSQRASSDPLPVVAVGGGVGKGHRHIQLPKRTPVGNLWLTVAKQFGSPIETFGDSNGHDDFFETIDMAIAESMTKKKREQECGHGIQTP